MTQTPTHIAIIMDGNGRWAKSRGLPRTAGHRQGAESVKTAIKAAMELNVSYLTLFGFSSENWQRPADEVDELMGLLRRYLKSEMSNLHEKGIRLRVIGDRARFDDDIITLIDRAEELTRANTKLNLTIALSYGSRAEITSAARALAQQVVDGKLNPADIDENKLSNELYTTDIPDPDLIIRTSGEKRISNFLLWQAAYAEFVFLETSWPDFSKQDMENAIAEFQQRERRFGATMAQ